MKDYANAEKNLTTATLRSEKLGLRVFRAQSQYQLGRALELSGKAARRPVTTRKRAGAADEVQKEAQTDQVSRRFDLAPIFSAKS